RFRTLIVFILLWSTLVYDPIAHWVWSSDGWLHKLGTLDFAGGTVVHASSGFAALAAAIVVGKRIDYQKDKAIEGNNVPLTILGGLVTYFMLVLRNKLMNVDDTLDVWAVHGMGGITGALLTGVFAEQVINRAGADGVFLGNIAQIWPQIVAVLATSLYSFVVT